MKRRIKQRFIFTGAFAVILMLLGYSVSIQAKGKEEVSLKDEIAFIEIEPPGKFEVQFKENGRKTGIAIFESNKNNFHWEITIKKEMVLSLKSRIGMLALFLKQEQLT